MRNRLLPILSASLLILLLPGCGGVGPEPAPTPAPGSKTEDDFSAFTSLTGGETPLFRHPGYYETTVPTGADSCTVDWTVARFPVNMSVYTSGHSQWVGYYNPNHQMAIAQRTLPTGPWRYCVLDEQVKWDSHNSITMMRDAKGVMHISGNMHAQPIVFFETDESGDISTLRRVRSLTGADESQVTYPKFIRLKDGTILFHYRTGQSGNGQEIYDVLGEDGRWSRYLDQPLTAGKDASGTTMNAYMLDPLTDPAGNFHLVWVWRNTPDCATNHDLSHAWSPDLKSWYTQDGKSVTLPISVDNPGLIVDDAPVGGGMLNGGQKLGFDAQGNPMISYYKYSEDGNSNFYLARWRDGAWQKARISDTGWRWNFSGGGSITTQMNVGAPVEEPDGQITVVCSRYYPELGAKASREVWLDGTTLVVLREAAVRSTAARWPSWVGKQQTETEVKLNVNHTDDLGDGGFILRWEAMDSNRDTMRTIGPLCDSSRLMVVKTFN
ncbi:MAG: BNR repeat-containing protein [Bacteroidales bacterium]|nr:BNR repeat-containing protein [Bacteroidales bacterium]